MNKIVKEIKTFTQLSVEERKNLTKIFHSKLNDLIECEKKTSMIKVEPYINIDNFRGIGRTTRMVDDAINTAEKLNVIIYCTRRSFDYIKNMVADKLLSKYGKNIKSVKLHHTINFTVYHVFISIRKFDNRDFDWIRGNDRNDYHHVYPYNDLDKNLEHKIFIDHTVIEKYFFIQLNEWLKYI